MVFAFFNIACIDDAFKIIKKLPPTLRLLSLNTASTRIVCSHSSGRNPVEARLTMDRNAPLVKVTVEGNADMPVNALNADR